MLKVELYMFLDLYVNVVPLLRVTLRYQVGRIFSYSV